MNSNEAVKERAEGVRVAYVAATRARDLLVVPVVGDETFPVDGWLSPLNKALYPTQADWRKSTPLPGYSFAAASVVERPLDYDRQEEFSVMPGIVQPQSGSHEVAWWDPFQLKLGEEGEHGLSQEDYLKDDGGQSLADYLAWQKEKNSVIQAASTPRFEVFLASQISENPPEQVPVEYVNIGDGGGRGRRYGTLVHSILRDIPLDAEADAIRKLSALNARILGATLEESNAAAETVNEVVDHPLLKRAHTSKRSHREYPISLALDGRNAHRGCDRPGICRKRKLGRNRLQNG